MVIQVLFASFFFVFIIVIGSMYFSYRMERLERENKDRDHHLSKDFKELIKRVEVLEKIITDKNYDLNDEINKL